MPSLFGDQPTLTRTTIQDQLGVISGPVKVSVSIVLSATMRTVDNYVIFEGEKLEVNVAADGTFSVSLPPNTEGTHYTVTYKTPYGVVTEKWVVPASETPLKLADVRVS